MNYFTALGITVAVIGACFLFGVLAIPIEVLTSYFSATFITICVLFTAAIYALALQRLNKRSKAA